MHSTIRRSVASLAAGSALLACQAALAGPPFMTDDPEPIEYRHSEAYVFSTMDKGPGGTQYLAPAFEFNTSPLEDLHLHAMVPFVSLQPDGAQNQYGPGDVELGVKYRFVHETDSRPQVGIFPMLELRTGDPDKGLGNGKTWWTFPVWAQKSFGPWTTYGGGGRAFNSAPGMLNYNFGGWLLQRSVTDDLILGGEVFAQGAQSVDGEHSTFLNFGGYYNNIKVCGSCSLLFRVGHSVAGETHTEAYLGLYWSWPWSRAEPRASH
jgi:hypothetical protein